MVAPPRPAVLNFRFVTSLVVRYTPTIARMHLNLMLETLAGKLFLSDIEVMDDQAGIHGDMRRDGVEAPHVHPCVSGSHSEK